MVMSYEAQWLWQFLPKEQLATIRFRDLRVGLWTAGHVAEAVSSGD